MEIGEVGGVSLDISFCSVAQNRAEHSLLNRFLFTTLRSPCTKQPHKIFISFAASGSLCGGATGR